jgi:hypothetical protein
VRKRTFAQQPPDLAKSQLFQLQKAVAFALSLATGLRNEGLPYDF